MWIGATDPARGMRSTVARRFAQLASIDSVNPLVTRTEYAVRGAILNRALELEKQLAAGETLPFKKSSHAIKILGDRDLRIEDAPAKQHGGLMRPPLLKVAEKRQWKRNTDRVFT